MPPKVKLKPVFDPDDVREFLKEHLSLSIKMGTDFTNPNELEVAILYDSKVVCRDTVHIQIKREYEG